MPNHKILFLCTGNYYRSRFAEELFNHLARQKGLDWAAESKGLAQDLWLLRNVGFISKYALQELEKRSVKTPKMRFPRKLKPGETGKYEIVVALNEEEHKPLIEQFYPQLSEVIYWDIKDLGDETSASAMSRIESKIEQLILEIAKDG
jgi:protein-tyrosine phosphatase